MNLKEMCKILGTNKEEITGTKRDKDICFNRHLICYFLPLRQVKFFNIKYEEVSHEY